MFGLFSKGLEEELKSEHLTEFHITLVKFLQPSYLQPVITQYFANNKSEIWS